MTRFSTALNSLASLAIAVIMLPVFLALGLVVVGAWTALALGGAAFVGWKLRQMERQRLA